MNTVVTSKSDRVGQNASDDETPYFSLVTGQFHSTSSIQNNTEIHSEMSALTIRSDKTAMMHSPASQKLATRSWQGLEITPSDEKSLEVQQGRFGNAARYACEPGANVEE
jgi:diphthamide biosynthesis protein 2